MKERVSRETDGFRPASVMGKQIDRIAIYDSGKILFRVDRGWLQHSPMGLSKINTDVDSFEIEEPKIANKLNLNRGDNFLIKEDVPYQGRSWALYIHASEAKVTRLPEKIEFEDELGAHLYTPVKIMLRHFRKAYHGRDAKGEAVYDLVQYDYLIESTTHRYELSTEGIKTKTLAEEIAKTAEVKIEPSDLAKILQHYAIERKERP